MRGFLWIIDSACFCFICFGDTKTCVGCFASFANCASTWNFSIVLSLDQLSLSLFSKLVKEIYLCLEFILVVYSRVIFSSYLAFSRTTYHVCSYNLKDSDTR